MYFDCMNEVRSKAQDACRQLIADKIRTLQQEIDRVEGGKHDETKSTSGDKHEVGRAMAQNELDRLKAQLAEQQKVAHVLQTLPKSSNDRVGLGSFVRTSAGDLLVAAALGKVGWEEGFFFAISPASPVGRELMGKVVKEEFSVNGRLIRISAVY